MHSQDRAPGRGRALAGAERGPRRRGGGVPLQHHPHVRCHSAEDGGLLGIWQRRAGRAGMGGGGGGARAPCAVGLQAEAAAPSVALSGAVRARSWQKGKTDGTVNMIATAATITAFCLIVSGPGPLAPLFCVPPRLRTAVARQF